MSTNACIITGSKYIQAYSLDFTAESSQTLSSNTTYTIGGKTWTKSNSASDNTAMAVTNGTGLVMRPKGDSTLYDNTGRTIPMLSTLMSGLIPGFTLRTPFRVQAYMSANNAAADFDFAILTVDNLTLASNAAFSFSSRKGYRGASGGLCHIANRTLNASFSIVAQTTNYTDNVIGFECPLGIAGAIGSWTSGAYSSGWPLDSAKNERGSYWPSGMDNSIVTAIGTAAQQSLILSAQRYASATALSVTWARLLVEYIPR